MINNIFKFSLSFLLFLFSLSILFAQNTSLPVVYATGGEGKNVVYKKLSKAERDEIPGYIWGVCSNCLGSDCNIRVSSTLTSQGLVNYSAKNIQDDDPTTAWIEGDSEYGIGHYFEFNDVHVFNGITILNGYQKSPKSFLENSRVKTLLISQNGINRSIIQLKDEMGVQSINTKMLRLKQNSSDNKIDVLRFTIMEVYPGSKFKDVGISEIYTSGCCVSGLSNIYLKSKNPKQIEDLMKKDSVKFIDEANNIIYASEIEIGKVMHDMILEIITENGSSILVTPNHSIYTGIFNKKKHASQLSLNDSLQLIDSHDKIIFDKISKIKELHNPIQTYYFKNLNFGNQKIIWPIRAIFNSIITDDEYLDKLNKLKIGINKFTIKKELE
jgi:hypothetical protein